MEAILAGFGMGLVDMFATPPAPGYIAVLRARLAATDARRLRQIAQCERAVRAMGKVEAALRQIVERLGKDDAFIELITIARGELTDALRVVGVMRDHI